MVRKNTGFTLIELSIVLVIIGLIVGGVLVGRDLVKAAQIRKQVSQISNLNTAVTTFKVKYNGLPGDITPAQAQMFGMVARAGTTDRGDGNGRLTVDSGHLSNENSMFWNDLSVAKLIAGDYSLDIDGNVEIPAGSVDLYLPKGEMNGSHLIVFYIPPGNGFGDIGGPVTFALANIASADSNGAYDASDVVTPLQAYAIDSKMDDGKPTTGVVYGGTYYSMAGPSVYFSQSPPCTALDGSEYVYDMTPPNNNTVNCIMSFVYR